MSSFQYLKDFVYTNHDRSPKELRVVGSLSCCRVTRQSESLFTPTLGFCLRVIVNENLINLEKTTSSVLAVILINLCVKLTLWLQLRSFTKRHLNCFKLFVQVYLKKKHLFLKILCYCITLKVDLNISSESWISKVRRGSDTSILYPVLSVTG